jgi:hypothetical protein
MGANQPGLPQHTLRMADELVRVLDTKTKSELLRFLIEESYRAILGSDAGSRQARREHQGAPG